ncbi:LssY C-terminal domain-containing protein [Arthrobacter sp. U41]|uniref:LssY C-terminal domain-containing protein n=1 Tax=Arthrobacter sp. U41 TaxID=1849032 RepID=UPI0011A5EBAC|nr:LssY C-terminal domain-containing protein [Arthrobacter sp. U41]
MADATNRVAETRGGIQDSGTVVDTAFFAFSGMAAIWLATLLFEESLHWDRLWFSVIFWAALAYLVLPRLHRILTRIYLPDYFIGRARTSDGLLGDPVNVALLGSEEQLHSAMHQAGWTLADDVDLASSRRIVTATLTRRSYDEAPVSPLFLFGRQQDFAYQQEVDGNPGKRHHIRFWRCPPGWVLPGGVKVDWLAAGTYDRSVGLSLFTLQITHKIEENTDTERDYVLASLQQGVTGVEVRLIRDFSTGYHARNGGGDSISTDGDLPVVDLTRLRPQPGTVVPVATDRRHRRPAPTLFGGVLVVLRGVAALALAAGLIAGSPAVVAEIDADALLPPVAVVLAVFGVTEILLAWFILRGGNRSRLGAMALSSAAIVTQWVAVLNGGPGVTFATNLVGLSLDILLIIALSSQRSRDFARQSGRHLATLAKAPRADVPGPRI